MNRAKRQAARTSWDSAKAYRANVVAKEAEKQRTIDEMVRQRLSVNPNSIKAAFASLDEKDIYGIRRHPLFKLIPRHTDEPLKKTETFEHFLMVIEKRAPRLIDPEFVAVFHEVSKLEHLRSIDAWKPKGKGTNTLFASLMDHLFSNFPMPRFIWSVFFGQQNKKFIDFALFVAKGGSPFKAIGLEHLTVPLTRKMCHELMLAPSDSTFMRAVRRAEIRAIGGSERLLDAIMSNAIGQTTRPLKEEAFVLSVLEWLTKNPMIEFGQISPVLDFLIDRWRRDEKFSMKGRSVLAVMRAMEEWHGQLAKQRSNGNYSFTPSGFGARTYEVGSTDSLKDVWTVTEIITSKELAEEGKKLHHCVYSYAHAILEGSVSIWSLRLNGERMVTIEVRNLTKAITQARGACNRTTNSQEFQILNRWANENGLRVSLGGW